MGVYRFPWHRPRQQLRRAWIGTRGRTFVPVGQALETDLAQAFKQPTRVNRATETDLAQPIAPARRRAIGQPLETELAQPIKVLKRRTLGQALETDLAQPVEAGEYHLVGRATETDLAQPIKPARRVILGRATELDAALPLHLSRGTTTTALASYDAYVSWNRAKTGYFTLDVSVLDGTDRLSPASLVVPDFDGPYDSLDAPRDPTWPRRVLTVHYWRGRSRTLENVEAGGFELDVQDPKGLYNPKNAASPLYGQSADSLRPARLRGRRAGGWQGLSFGFTRDLQYEPHGRKGVAHLSATDLFIHLADPFKPSIGALGPTTTGGAIEAIHTALGWTDPAYQDFGIGDALLNFSADGTRGGLDLIADLLAVEFGIYFLNGDGVATYQDRSSRYNAALAATIVNDMRAIGPGASLDRIVNDATYTKEGSTPQRYTDAISADLIRGFGPRTYELTSPYLVSDDAAYQRATYKVNLQKDPVGEIWQLTIDNRTPPLLDNILALDLGDLIGVDEAQTGTSGEFFIERLEGTIDLQRRRHTVVYTLSEKGPDLFALDSSLLDGAALLAL